MLNLKKTEILSLLKWLSVVYRIRKPIVLYV